MTDRLVSVFASIARATRAILGVPDYERYLANARESDCPKLSREEFYRERLEAKYSKPGTRCC